MTPTLGMVVQREAAISAFVQEPFYTVRLLADGCEAVSDRFTEKSAATALRGACKKEMQAVVKTVIRKEKQEKPPALYDLTTLQRDANRLLGFTAQQTLTYLQSLYERKLATYPRTDSRYLTEDMADRPHGQWVSFHRKYAAHYVDGQRIAEIKAEQALHAGNEESTAEASEGAVFPRRS